MESSRLCHGDCSNASTGIRSYPRAPQKQDRTWGPTSEEVEIPPTDTVNMGPAAHHWTKIRRRNQTRNDLGKLIHSDQPKSNLLEDLDGQRSFLCQWSATQRRTQVSISCRARREIWPTNLIPRSSSNQSGHTLQMEKADQKWSYPKHLYQACISHKKWSNYGHSRQIFQSYLLSSS